MQVPEAPTMRVAVNSGAAWAMMAGGRGLVCINSSLRARIWLPSHSPSKGRCLRHGSTMCSATEGNSKVSDRTTEQVWKQASTTWTENGALMRNLQLIKTALGTGNILIKENVTLTGKAMTWGIESEWILKWWMNGYFYERLKNHQFTHEWGHDGRSAWHADAAGRVSKMELDEGEVSVLSMWVRTGFWVTEKAQTCLEIQQEPPGPTAAFFSPDTEMVFSIRMKGKAAVAYVIVSKGSWLPIRMSFQQFCFRDRWKFSNWQNVLPDRYFRLPIFSSRASSSVGQENFKILKVEVNGVDAGLPVYDCPSTLLVLRDDQRYPRAEIDSKRPASVQMRYANTGHYMVRPILDGKEAACFIVDTGTGCLALNSKKAIQLGMESFGEVYATSISGGHVMKTQFLRGKSFQLGRLKITDPLFMEVNVDKLVKYVDGICGFDIFYGSIVEMSPRYRTLSFYEPSEFMSLPRAKNLRWQRMFLFDNVPHIFAKVNDRDVMLMLDTGAGGAKLMFPNNVVEGFDDPEVDTPIVFRGRRLVVSQADYGNVSSFEIAGSAFKDVVSLVPSKSAQKMGLSSYCAGIFCAEMVEYFTLVFDYSNRRMAFIDHRLRHLNSS